MAWSNTQYANWLIRRKIKPNTLCLVELEYNDDGEHKPLGIAAVSANGLESKDMAAPDITKWYQFMYFLIDKPIKSQTEPKYAIGLSEPFKPITYDRR